MRPALLIAAALALVVLGATSAALTGPDASRDDGGLSLTALSRCAGIAGSEVRQADPAFGLLMLDGSPWVTAQRNHDTVLLAGTGTLRRRDGTNVPFRFSCLLNEKGQALVFRISLAEPDSANPLPPSRLLTGRAALDTKDPLPHGAELRLQLFDIAKDPAGELLTEQVARSGWETPIPFALRLPADTDLAGRKLALAARVTLARRTVFAMNPRTLAPEELARPLALTLKPVPGR